LQRHFLEKFAAQYNKPVTGITRRAQNRMATYTWPGNVRELENTIGNACMMADGPVIDINDLPEPVRGLATAAQDDNLAPLHEMQRRHVIRVLEHVGGNKSQAAEILGISRATVYQLLAETKAKDGTG